MLVLLTMTLAVAAPCGATDDEGNALYKTESDAPLYASLRLDGVGAGVAWSVEISGVSGSKRSGKGPGTVSWCTVKAGSWNVVATGPGGAKAEWKVSQPATGHAAWVVSAPASFAPAPAPAKPPAKAVTTRPAVVSSPVSTPTPPTSREQIFVSVGSDRPANATGIVGELIGIPSGTWWMGSLAGKADHQPDEGPVLATVARQQLMKREMNHDVWVNKLHLAPTWGDQACLDDSGVALKDSGACPVTGVSWCQAVVAANTASGLDGLPKAYSYRATDDSMFKADYDTCKTLAAQVKVDVKSRGYRLPTEAEWEWGARGHEWYTYAGSDSVAEVGWISPDAKGVHPGCSSRKRANGWGLCDMTGNVWEWVQDVYASPLGARASLAGAGGRVYRGGGWVNSAGYARVANRLGGDPGSRSDLLGFRLTRAVP